MHQALATIGQTVEVTVGARDGQRGIITERVTDTELFYRIVLVRFCDGTSAWYGNDELAAS